MQQQQKDELGIASKVCFILSKFTWINFYSPWNQQKTPKISENHRFSDKFRENKS